jgi:RNA polymerase sigma factor, sigma-70 family
MTRKEITQFYKEHHRRLYNIAWRILRDSGEAEEVMQDTILKFVSEERSFASDAQVSAWLARTCIHAAIDRLRRRRREDAFLEEYAASSDIPADAFPVIPDSPFVIPGEDPESPGFRDGLTVSRIRAAMDTLPEPYRLVLNLVLIEGLDYEEIAALTGSKETTLRSLYSRGRARLAENLRKKI